jgi:proteasome lid subunit RPN8/RPN11
VKRLPSLLNTRQNSNNAATPDKLVISYSLAGKDKDMKRTWKILQRSYRDLLKVARQEGKDDKEICGFLIDNGYFLQLHRTQNTCTREGSFSYCKKEVRTLEKAVKRLGIEIIGTFHSHPISEAVPGPNDIKYAVEDSLMLIFDCIGKEARLWHIKDGRCSRREIDLI